MLLDLLTVSHHVSLSVSSTFVAISRCIVCIFFVCSGCSSSSFHPRRQTMAFDRLLQSIARLLLVYLQERCLELMVRATLLFVLDTVIVILDCATGVHFDDIDLSPDKVIHLC